MSTATRRLPTGNRGATVRRPRTGRGSGTFARQMDGDRGRSRSRCALAASLGLGGLRRRRAPGRRRDGRHLRGRGRRRRRSPTKQRLAKQEELAIAVAQRGQQRDAQRRGDGRRASQRRSEQAGLADPERPVWIVDAGPRGGTTAYTNTWALGPLPRRRDARPSPGASPPVKRGHAHGQVPRRRRPRRQGQGAPRGGRSPARSRRRRDEPAQARVDASTSVRASRAPCDPRSTGEVAAPHRRRPSRRTLGAAGRRRLLRQPRRDDPVGLQAEPSRSRSSESIGSRPVSSFTRSSR